MCSVAAETALRSLRESDPSLILNCKLLAWSGDVGQNRSTEGIVSSIGSVHSFPVVLRIIESLTIDTVHGFIDSECLVEVDVEGVVINGRRDCQQD